MPSLVPCPTCARHVKADDPTCPFCGAQVPRAEAATSRSTAGRLSQAALFAGAAVVAAGDCSAAPAPMPPYGAVPVVDAAPFATSGSSAGDSGEADAGETLDGADGG